VGSLFPNNFKTNKNKSAFPFKDHFNQVQSISCIDGSGISAEGSNQIVLKDTNQAQTCATDDTGCLVRILVSYLFSFVFSKKLIIIFLF